MNLDVGLTANRNGNLTIVSFTVPRIVFCGWLVLNNSGTNESTFMREGASASPNRYYYTTKNPCLVPFISYRTRKSRRTNEKA